MFDMLEEFWDRTLDPRDHFSLQRAMRQNVVSGTAILEPWQFKASNQDLAQTRPLELVLF